MPTYSLILTTLLLAIYAWLSGIQCGLGLLRLLPASALTKHSLRLFVPKWEASNLFLILGLASFAILFSHSLSLVVVAVRPFLVAGLAALIVRICLFGRLFYGKGRCGFTFSNVLFLVAGLAVPLAMGAAGIRLLIGYDFWQTAVGWGMMLSLAAGLVALAMSYVYYEVGLTPQGRIQLLSRSLNLLFCALVASVLYQLVHSRQPHLMTFQFTLFVVLVSLTILWQALLWASARDRYMWWYLSLLALIGPLLLALANRPYLAFPEVDLGQAYSIGSSTPLAAAGVEVASLVLVVAFASMAWRLLRPER